MSTDTIEATVGVSVLVNCVKKWAHTMNAMIRKAEKNRFIISLLSGFFNFKTSEQYYLIRFYQYNVTVL